MIPETSLGQGGTQFPDTRWSMLLRGRGDGAPGRRDLMQELIHSYWRPVYVNLRRFHRLSIEDAKDATQEFFSGLMDADGLKSLDPGKGSFRGFIKISLKNFMIDAARARQAWKRGGRAAGAVPIEDVEHLVADENAPPPEASFDREWRRSVMDAGLQRLKKTLEARGKPLWFEMFRRHMEASLNDPGPVTYRTIAKHLGVSESDVRNGLHWARVLYRIEVIGVIRESTSSEEELEREMRDLFGA